MNEQTNNNQTSTPEQQSAPAPAPAPAQRYAPAPAPAPEKTFTQAELDAIVGKRIAHAMKGMPKEDELAAFRTWRESQQTEKERWDTLKKEHDTAKTELQAALAELEQYKREKYLLSKGVSQNDADYYAYKIGKMVDENTDFEKAAGIYLKEHPPAGTVQVEFAGPLNGQRANTTNDMMNSLIRGIRR